MSEIKALEKLREYAEQCCPEYEDHDARMMEIADAIEAEIAERYLLLPVDVDGVPIRCGDRIQRTTSAVDNVVTVIGVNGREFFFNGPNFMEPGIKKNVGNAARHVPRTLEDALNDFGEKVWNTACAPEGYTWSNANLDADLERCAEEIRGLMGKDGRI